MSLKFREPGKLCFLLHLKLLVFSAFGRGKDSLFFFFFFFCFCFVLFCFVLFCFCCVFVFCLFVLLCFVLFFVPWCWGKKKSSLIAAEVEY